MTRKNPFTLTMKVAALVAAITAAIPIDGFQSKEEDLNTSSTSLSSTEDAYLVWLQQQSSKSLEGFDNDVEIETLRNILPENNDESFANFDIKKAPWINNDLNYDEMENLSLKGHEAQRDFAFRCYECNAHNNDVLYRNTQLYSDSVALEILRLRGQRPKVRDKDISIRLGIPEESINLFLARAKKLSMKSNPNEIKSNPNIMENVSNKMNNGNLFALNSDYREMKNAKNENYSNKVHENRLALQCYDCHT